jgi:hypothetical protein
MRSCSFVCTLAACLACTTASANQICYERTGQFATMRHCVTSIREPQGETTFGPEHLAATDEGAWCASVERDQSVTLRLDPPAPLRTVTLTNGNAKSNEAFRQNGRVKRAVIETNTGYQGYIEPRDTSAAQKFIIAKGTYAWVRLKILESTRGSPNATVCLSEFLVNLEELANK